MGLINCRTGYPESAVWQDDPNAILRLACDGPMQSQNELPFLLLMQGNFSLIFAEALAGDDGRTI